MLQLQHYTGWHNGPKELLMLHQEARVIETNMARAREERQALADIERLNDEEAIAQEVLVREEDTVVPKYNLVWLNELIECSKYDTLDNFLHAFEADRRYAC